MSGGTAMVMAGGQGMRMQRSGMDVPKALVPVAGVPLIERNVRQLARSGFTRVMVATPPAGSPVAVYAAETVVALAHELGIEVSIHPEERPLGNIGAVSAAAGLAEPLLVVFADNLTALDLRAIRDFHIERGAALTLAVHTQPFKMPFGEVVVEGDAITDYIEKPTYQIPVCSAVAVLSPEAIALVGADESVGISDLARRAVAAGLPVLAFRHEALWIDVNEQADVIRAEQMVAGNPEAFAL